MEDDDDDQLQKTSASASEDAAKVDSKADIEDHPNNPISQESKKQLRFSADEETLIVRMYSLVGERWSLIAGRIPGRSAEEIERYWNSRQSSSEQKPKNSVLVPTQVLDHNHD